MSTRAQTKLSGKIRNIVVRAAEYLCRESQYGSWGDARISAMCIGALNNCGLAVTHPDFISYSARQLLNSEQCVRDEAGLSLNLDAWDTSVALIALKSSADDDLRSDISDLVDWLLEEFSEDLDNMHQDPWDTLYTLYALQASGIRRKPIPRIMDQCVSWVLDRRNPAGVLISSHYVGLLLPVIRNLLQRRSLPPRKRRAYERVIHESIDFLKRDFVRQARKGMLWSDEAWGIGHILFGVSSAVGFSSGLSEDSRFNKFLVEWCSDNWDNSLGWTDHYETALMLMGLSEYYIARRMHGDSPRAGDRSEAQREIADSVQFKFRRPKAQSMTVYPIWRQRNFVSRRKSCCLLMPLSESWSKKVRGIMQKTIKQLGFEPVLPDALPDGEIMEGIWRSINEARVVIADITGRNPNVLYEIGIAHTVGKDVILVAQDITDKKIPFDIHSRRVIDYKVSDTHSVLAPRLRDTIRSILVGKF